MKVKTNSDSVRRRDEWRRRRNIELRERGRKISRRVNFTVLVPQMPMPFSLCYSHHSAEDPTLLSSSTNAYSNFAVRFLSRRLRWRPLWRCSQPYSAPRAWKSRASRQTSSAPPRSFPSTPTKKSLPILKPWRD